MGLSITTEEATEIKSNNMKLNANVNDLGEHEIALCYFNYGHKSDLSDAQKSTGCALVDQPGHIEFLQDFIDDNQDYYYEANLQNYEGTENQDLYLENMKTFNLNPELFADEKIAEFIANNQYSLTKLLSDKDLMYSYFSSGNLNKMWHGEITKFNEDYIYTTVYNSSGTESKKINCQNKIDLTNINTINIDWENTGLDHNYNYSYFLVNGSRKKIKRNRFDRMIDSIDVSEISGFCSISIEARDGYPKPYVGEARARSSISFYGIWLEK